ncbi:tripartite tricarboxylate transporter TctB family protein [Bradyrhizobium sp. CNPSo 4019]|uniref:Tripartite tricarboxylate transporter TctB family protein n=2 Tax=Bradyrhizobium diversitatis TaxID=2755406 RepID=A0ABS0NV37_9BRAD|nr:tripartite tricarboxylate transporter TctB family protein [Bradyrhizobium diversitatis]
MMVEAAIGVDVPSAPKIVRSASLILTALGLFYLHQASMMPLGDPPGTGIGAVPLMVGTCWVAFGLYVTIRNQSGLVDSGPWPKGRAALRALYALLLCVVYIVGLPFLGIFITTGVFLVLMARLAGAPSTSALVVAVMTPIAFWVIFSLGLKVSLPYGSLLAAVLGS